MRIPGYSVANTNGQVLTCEWTLRKAAYFSTLLPMDIITKGEFFDQKNTGDYVDINQNWILLMIYVYGWRSLRESWNYKITCMSRS